MEDSPRAADVKEEAEQLEGSDHRYTCSTCQCSGRCLKDETGKRVRGREYTPVHVTLLLRGKHTARSAVVLTGLGVLASVVAALLRPNGISVRVAVVPSQPKTCSPTPQ